MGNVHQVNNLINEKILKNSIELEKFTSYKNSSDKIMKCEFDSFEFIVNKFKSISTFWNELQVSKGKLNKSVKENFLISLNDEFKEVFPYIEKPSNFGCSDCKQVRYASEFYNFYFTCRRILK